MRTRRGSSYWTSELAGMIRSFSPGDIVNSIFVGGEFIGIVRRVDEKCNKVTVAWSGGSEVQHDPDEIQLSLHQTKEVREKMASMSSRRTASKVDDYLQKFKDKMGKNTSEQTAMGWIEGAKLSPRDEKKIKGLVKKYIKTAMGPEQAEANPQFVGDPETHGIDKPRGGGFSIMQNLQKDLRKEEKEIGQQVMVSPIQERGGKAASCACGGHDVCQCPPKPKEAGEMRSRRAIYWGGPERVYRKTRNEQGCNRVFCPKCKEELNKQNFTRSVSLFVCGCGFKVPSDKMVTERPVIEVAPAEPEVVLASRRGR